MKKMYTIKDTKVGNFFPPSFVTHLTEYVRGLQLAVADEKSNLHLYPQDFALYHLGEFDERTGHIESINPPVEIMQIQELFDKQGDN